LILCAVQTGDEHEQTGRKRRTKRTKESSHKKNANYRFETEKSIIPII